jgi:hypothetical protein
LAAKTSENVVKRLRQKLTNGLDDSKEVTSAGATTLGIKTLRIMKLSIMTVSNIV